MLKTCTELCNASEYVYIRSLACWRTVRPHFVNKATMHFYIRKSLTISAIFSSKDDTSCPVSHSYLYLLYYFLLIKYYLNTGSIILNVFVWIDNSFAINVNVTSLMIHVFLNINVKYLKYFWLNIKEYSQVLYDYGPMIFCG